MKEENVYFFEGRRLGWVTDIALFLGLLLILSVLCYQLFYKPFVLLLVVILPGYILYLQYYTIRVTQQFSKFDEEKRVVINVDNTQLTLTRNGDSIIITNDEIERVEVYEQKYLGKFGNYNYLVIYPINKKEILLTNFTIPLLVHDKALEKFLRKKPRIYYKKQFNYIDESKFDSHR